MEKVLEKELTSREFVVLKLMVTGVTNSFIAKELCVTEATVKAHISHIFEKMKVQNRIQAVVKAIREEIV